MGISHAELTEKGSDQIDLLLAGLELEGETGSYGQNLVESTSEVADPNFYGDGAVRYVPFHVVDHAEAAVEKYKKDNDLPPGAMVMVDRKTY